MRILPVFAAGMLLAGCGARRPLRVLVVDGPVGRAFKEVVKRHDVAVTALLYDELLEQATDQLGRSDPDVDLVMLDDTWMPASWDRLRPVPLGSHAKNFLPLALDLSQYDSVNGNVRALPFVSNAQVLFYHSELVMRPTHWDDVFASAALARRQHNCFGFAFRGAFGHSLVADYLPFLWGKNGDLDLSPKARQVFSMPAAAQALELMERLAALGPVAEFGFSAPEIRTNFAARQSAMGIHWLASIDAMDRPEHDEWTPLPDNFTGVFSTWVIGCPKNLSAARANRAMDFLHSLVETSDYSGASNDLLQAAKSAQAIPVVADRDGCHWMDPHQIGQRVGLKGPCQYFPVRVRPQSPKWLQIETTLSVYLSRALTGIIPKVDDAIAGAEKAVREMR